MHVANVSGAILDAVRPWISWARSALCTTSMSDFGHSSTSTITGRHTALAARLGIHVAILTSWVGHGIIKAHAYNGRAWLYEEPRTPPAKHCSRWDRLVDRASAIRAAATEEQRTQVEPKEV